MHVVLFAAIVCLSILLGITIVLLFAERQRRKDATFIVTEALIALRTLFMRCVSCDGTGTTILTGRRRRCTVCADARHSYNFLFELAQQVNADDRR